MPTYDVSKLEVHIRYGSVEADSPEEALALAEDGSDKVAWNEEAEFLHDKEESAEVRMPDGTTYGF